MRVKLLVVVAMFMMPAVVLGQSFHRWGPVPLGPDADLCINNFTDATVNLQEDDLIQGNKLCVITNDGATVSQTFNLVAVHEGLPFYFVNMEDVSVNINPQTADSFQPHGCGAGVSLDGDSQAWQSLFAFGLPDDTTWFVPATNRVWTCGS